MRCPTCGVEGSKHDESKFEVRGQVDGAPIRKCLSCGTGFTFGFFARTKPIPAPLWQKMEAEWERHFGPSQEPPGMAIVEKTFADLDAIHAGEADAEVDRFLATNATWFEDSGLKQLSDVGLMVLLGRVQSDQLDSGLSREPLTDLVVAEIRERHPRAFDQPAQ